MTDTQTAAAMHAEVMAELRAIRAALKGGSHAPSAAVSTQAAPREPGSSTAWVRGTPAPLASDADLDGEHGDPVMVYSPKKWTGPSYAGKRFSEIPAECLLVHAEELEWKAANPMAGKPEKIPMYQRREAGRARGWAARNAKNPPKPQPAGHAYEQTGGFGSDDGGIPF